ncbi:MAG: tetratricopeptide repeat protein [Campylobacterota bacterium]
MIFLYENVFYFMFLPTLVLLFFIIKKQEKIDEYFSKDIIEKLSLKNKYFSKKARAIMLVLSLLFMIMALSRPVTNEKIYNINQDLHTDIYPKSSKDPIKKIKTYTELFYYPLAIALVLLFMALFSLPTFKKTNISSYFFLAFLSLFIINNKAQASIFDFLYIKKANNYYKKQEYKKAYKEYKKIENSPFKFYNLANTLYKQKKYTQAAYNYTKVKTQNRDLNFNKYHNLGNAYAMNKNYQKAISSYKKALKIKDENKTKQNLQKVKELLLENNSK